MKNKRLDRLLRERLEVTKSLNDRPTTNGESIQFLADELAVMHEMVPLDTNDPEEAYERLAFVTGALGTLQGISKTLLNDLHEQYEKSLGVKIPKPDVLK